LLIGGPHRAGTTIIWKAIASHPEIVGFGDRFETGVDYSEGVLFQDVYPRFGVGMEFKKNFGKSVATIVHAEQEGPTDLKPTIVNQNGGLGQYALLPEEKVHWTKENRRDLLQNPTTLSRLLNRFAPYWDQNSKFDRKDGLLKAKVFVEKSPQNAVLSLFLEGVYNMQISEDGSVNNDADRDAGDGFGSIAPKVDGQKTVTKFLFMTRHPIANMYAHDSFIRDAMRGTPLPFETYMRNYLQVHNYILMDVQEMTSPFMWVRLEDFTLQPEKVLRDIFSFLSLEENLDDTVRDIISSLDTIDPNPNAKYIQLWCEKGLKEHGDLVRNYDSKVRELGLGYDLVGLCQQS